MAQVPYPAAVQTSLDYAFGQGVPRDMAKATAMLELSRKLGVRATLTYVHSNVALKIASDLASAEVEEQMTKALTEAQQEIQLGIARSLADQYLVMERGEIIKRGAGADMEKDVVRELLAV